MNSKTFNLSMPQELLTQIDRQAKKQGSNRSDFIRRAAYSMLAKLQQWDGLQKSARKQYQGPKLNEQEVADLVRGVRENKT